jgi:hypothetical protein
MSVFFNNLVMILVSFPKHVEVAPSPFARDDPWRGLVCVCFKVRMLVE